MWLHGTTLTSYRWCFYLNVIVCGVSIILFIFCYQPPKFHQLQRGVTRREQLKRIDYGGFVLYAGGLVCLLLALCQLSAHIETLSLLTGSQLGEVNNIHGKALNVLQHSLWASLHLSPSSFTVSHTSDVRITHLINA